MSAVKAHEPRYLSKDLCERAEITFRQLDHWCRIGLLHPAWCEWGTDQHGEPTYYATAWEGSGRRRLFAERELRKAQAMARMLRAGLTFDRAWAAIRAGQEIVCTTVPLGVGEAPPP